MGLPSIQERYKRLFKEIIVCANYFNKIAAKEGKVLDPIYWDMAVKAGIKKPYKIKILAKEFEFKGNKLNYIARKLGLYANRMAGVAVGYNIIIHPRFILDENILAHELRHVAQFIACDSLEIYLEYYMLELLHYGYGAGPFEQDASISLSKQA